VPPTNPAAVVRLRTQLNLNQKDFAAAAGLSLRSTARYESGEKPTARALARLSALALAHDLKDLHDIFDAQLKAALTLRAEKQHSGLASPGKERRIPVEQLMRRAADQESIRYACRNIFTIASRIQLKLAEAADYQSLVDSLAVDVGAVQAIARGALTTSEELATEDVSFILGPGDNTTERQDLEKYIKYPNTKPQKESWQLIEAYIRRTNSARANKKKLKAGLDNLEKEFGDPEAVPAKRRAKKRA
jgi:transcriptional regulator with XRE-family HTH domain